MQSTCMLSNKSMKAGPLLSHLGEVCRYEYTDVQIILDGCAYLTQDKFDNLEVYAIKPVPACVSDHA